MVRGRAALLRIRGMEMEGRQRARDMVLGRVVVEGGSIGVTRDRQDMSSGTIQDRVREEGDGVVDMDVEIRSLMVCPI